jgi:hypothetical protein
MSQENLDIVTRALRAALARPDPDFATVNELYAPDHVLVPAGVDMVERELHGARGFRTWREETQELVDADFDIRGAVDVGPEKGSRRDRDSLQGEGQRLRLRAAHVERGHRDQGQDHPDRVVR